MKSLKIAIKNLRRSPYQSLAAFLMTSITFFVVTIFAIIVYTTQNLLTYFETRPQVTAFFVDKAKDEDIEKLKNKLNDTGLLKEIKYISKTDALEIYQSQNKDNALLLEMVTADILPASLEVSAKNVKDLEAIANIMRSDANVEEVIYQKDVADTLKKWVDGIRLGGLTLTALLIFGSFVTLVLVLGMRVAVRRNEIKTLSLLGASGWYIRRPFLVEGLVYAFIGVFVGWGLANLIILYLTPNLLDFFSGMNIFPLSLNFTLLSLAGEVIIATILGMISSLSATRRYGR